MVNVSKGACAARIKVRDSKRCCFRGGHDAAKSAQAPPKLDGFVLASLRPEAACPSGLRATDRTGSAWPSKVCLTTLLDTSQIFMVLPLLPEARNSPLGLIRWDIPRPCRGGSRSLTVPGVCFVWAAGVAINHSPPHEAPVLLLTSCDQTPLRGQQP